MTGQRLRYGGRLPSRFGSVHGTLSSYGVGFDGTAGGYLMSIDREGEANWIRAVHADAFPDSVRYVAIGTDVTAGSQGPIGITGVQFVTDSISILQRCIADVVRF